MRANSSGYFLFIEAMIAKTLNMAINNSTLLI